MITEEEHQEIEDIVKRVILRIDSLTLHVFLYEIGEESLVQIAGDVVIIAMSLGKGDDIESITQNTVLNWRHEIVQRYSHPRVYRHFFN